ncbi:MAG: outer membrane protein transport protein [Pseudomonadales bacterium]|nr:outer membrane protein transport protein [Pseudomonadales bacterium]
MDFKLLSFCFRSLFSFIVVFTLLGAEVSFGQMAQNLMLGNAKALSLGNAVTADPPGIDSIHFNPAGLAKLKGRQRQLKFILASADIRGEFSTNEAYNRLVDNAGFSGQDSAADQESEIETFAIYLPGSGITKIPFAAAPLGGISISPPGSKMTFATSVYAPMILGLTRDDDDPGRFAGKSLAFTRLTFFSPSIGYQVTDTLAVGASLGFSYTGFGLDLDYRASNIVVGGASGVLGLLCNDPSQAPLQEFALFFADLCQGTISPFEPIFNLQVDLEKAVSFTYNFGVLWDVTPWLTWGLAYQSEANDTLEGDIAITFDSELVNLYNGIRGPEDNRGLLAPLVDALTLPENGVIESKGRVNLVTPQHLSTGISLMLTPRLKFNVDVKWTETSKWESFRFEFDKNINVLGLLGAIGVSGVETNALDIPRGYEDTINWGYGVEYLYTDDLKLRMGYEPRKAGIPDDKLDFVLPLGDMDLYSVGFSYNIDSETTFDMAFGYTKSEQDIPAGSSTNGNDTRTDNFVYNPYAGLDVKTVLEVFMVEMSYQSHF